MSNVTVRITELNEDINIYTKVSEISIKDDMIKITNGDDVVEHLLSESDEITIKANRHEE